MDQRTRGLDGGEGRGEARNEDRRQSDVVPRLPDLLSRALTRSKREERRSSDGPPMRTLARGPWPQPSPWLPDRMMPAVLHVPEDVRRDWLENVKRRYLRQLVAEVPSAYLWALRNRGLAGVSDARFVALLCDGIVARFLTPDLDAFDRRLFRDQLASEAEGERVFFKSDFRIMGLVTPDDESNAAPCVVLFGRDEEHRFSLDAIAVDDEVFTPTDGEEWELAKTFALQSAGVSTTLHMHPRLHFPTDAINAIAYTRLPDGHLLKELLRPHLRLELGVSDAVLHGTRSVLRPGHVYSPYPGTHEENLRLVATIWTGFPHRDGSENRAYPAYRFPMGPLPIHAPYGRFLERYFATIERFVAAVVARIDDHEDVRDFAHHVAAFIPGFPDERAIRDPKVLASAIASIIFSVSVAHSADHHLYGQVDPREMPFRIKSRRPSREGGAAVDRSTMVDTRDLVAATMCSRMYFRPHVVERLIDADYRFGDPDAVRATGRFRRELRETEGALTAEGLRNYVPLSEIACSVQF